MFVKPLVKYNKTTKRRYNIYQLCESFRLEDRIRHRVIIGLGKLDELPGEELKKLLGKRIEELLTVQNNNLSLYNLDETVEKLEAAKVEFDVLKSKADIAKELNLDFECEVFSLYQPHKEAK